MTVLGALLRSSPEDPRWPLTSSVLSDWLTGGSRSEAGVAVTERRVLGLPAYYRALALTAGTLAGLPQHVYRNGTRDQVQQRTVLDSPNPRHTPIEFWFTMYANGLGWGNCFARKLRDGTDTVREVWPLHPSRVRVEEDDPTPNDPAGKLFLIHDRHGVEQRYRSWDIFHLPYVSPDGVQGVRPLEIFRQSLGIAIAGDDNAAKFYGAGSRISGVLTTDKDLDDTRAQRLKRRFKEKTAGPDNAHDVAVLDNGVKFTPLAIPPADAQLLESRQWSVAEIARMVGTPPHLVGDVERSTSWGSGIEEQVLGWVKFTLNTWIVSAEQRITRELLPGGWTAGQWYMKCSLEGLLRGDSKARASLYHSMITDGWGTRNEARDLEDRAPLDGLDEPIVPSNMTLISVDGQLVPLAAQNDAIDTAPTEGV